MLNLQSLSLFSFLIVFFCSSVFAGIDESRKIISKPNGEKENFSELRRPGTAHLDWSGINLHIFEDEIRGSEVAEKNYPPTQKIRTTVDNGCVAFSASARCSQKTELRRTDLAGAQKAVAGLSHQGRHLSIYGAMDQKWHREVLGETVVENTINSYPLPPERWSSLKFYDYDHDLIYYGPITRHASDPYWRLGSFLEWIQLEPGLSKVRRLADESKPHLAWNHGLPDWQNQSSNSSVRPIENIPHSSLFA